MHRILLIIFTLLLNVANAYAGPETKQKIESYPHSIHDWINSPIQLSFGYAEPPDYNIMDHITWNKWSNVPGAIQLEFIGIHGDIFSQINKRIKQQAQDDLRIQYNLSNMSDSNFRTRMEATNVSHNFYGEWGDRSWIHSLPPEKGGAPKDPIIYSYGWELNTEAIPLVGWFKEKFSNLGDIWISADHEFEEERGPTPQRNDRKVDNNPDNLANPRISSASLLAKEEYRWFEGKNFHLRFRPIIKMTTDTLTMVEEIALRTQIELYSDNKSNHFGNINLFVKHDFADNNTFFSAFIEVLTW